MRTLFLQGGNQEVAEDFFHVYTLAKFKLWSYVKCLNLQNDDNKNDYLKEKQNRNP